MMQNTYSFVCSVTFCWDRTIKTKINVTSIQEKLHCCWLKQHVWFYSPRCLFCCSCNPIWRLFRSACEMCSLPCKCVLLWGFVCRGKIVLGYTEAELRVRGSGYQFIHAADMLYCAENHVRSKFRWLFPACHHSARAIYRAILQTTTR